jgi:nicotinate-nucleotide adenylyltransferase
VKIGLFGGTFDPIHCGHLGVARAVRERFHLDRVYVIPAGSPPHKNQHSSFEHRLAMVALACAGDPHLVPSAVEAPRPARPSYSILTLRRFRRELGAGAALHFIIGADAFLGIRSWQQWRALLRLTNFVVVSRPGFDLARVETVLPRPWKRRGTPRDRQGLEYRLQETSVFVISELYLPISGTDIRAALAPARRGASRPSLPMHKMLPPPVAEYLQKTALYGDTGR